jgi:nicotinate-nucleotide adenylyltransferase
MKTGVYGGTFDPIHNGHLITAVAIKEIRNLDKIIFIPSYIAPHKIGVQRSSSVHRIEMIKRAIEGIPFLDYSTYEIDKKGVSYTIDTLRHLKKEYDEIELIIGYDNLLEFKTWKEPDEIFKLVKVVCLSRNVPPVAVEKDRFYNAAEIINTPTIDINATAIRNRVRENKPINFLVPEAVMEYIYRSNLYKD